MSGSDQATEVFRFACARPALKDVRSVKVRRHNEIAPLPRDGPEPATNEQQQSRAAIGIAHRNFKYGDNIKALEQRLKLNSENFKIGLNTELDPELVRLSIRKSFEGHHLATLIETEDWSRDERQLDRTLIQLYDEAADPDAVGPHTTRWRQLYDLVRQAVDSVTGKEGKEPFILRGLELAPQQLSDSTRVTRLNDLSVADQTLTQTITIRTLHSEAEKVKDQKIKNLVDGLRYLNTPAFYEQRVVNKAIPGHFLVMSDWPNHLPEGPREVLNELRFGNGNTVLQSIGYYYNKILDAIKDAAAPIADAPAEFKGGLFSIGPFNLEMTKPWTWTAGDAPTRTQQQDTPEPIEPTKSKIKPTGVADLMVVRDHVYQYIGGDIGAIQNVLKSEEMVHETKRLGRTELVEFSSSETITENEQEQTTGTRFALSKEANEVIKKDGAMKAGVSTTAYGPYISVKGDLSYAENNNTESANKISSQYSQDITSRATSKIIEKAFKSTSLTTISEFQEAHRHTFKNTDPTSTNISGVYQWVNKVSQCQMYNYGKRLLLDIVVPEPAAFLMTQSANTDPSLEKPLPLTETAADLHEGNYSVIAARYQASGVKAPGDILSSFTKSFKADISPHELPKPAQGNARIFGGHANVNMDIKIPSGYLAYAAKIQVGVRTGPGIGRWTPGFPSDSTTPWFPELIYPERKVSAYISVGGRLIRGGKAPADELNQLSSDTVNEADRSAIEADLVQDSVGMVFFTDTLVGDEIGIAITQEFVLGLTGTIQVYCIRKPSAYSEWQQTTYEAILTAYTKLKMDYERARAESAISSMSVVTGNNPLENKSIISTELKKASIAFISEQNFKVFGSIVQDSVDGFPQVEKFERAIKQGKYAEFFERAFEWENIAYELYPYFWADRNSWRERMGFHSPDPVFSQFVKAGMAKVTVPARLGFGLEVLHLLETGATWKSGPVSTLRESEYYSVAQEILRAELDPKEVRVSDPWYTVIPTDLVKLRKDDELPEFELDKAKGIWVEKEKAPGGAGRRTVIEEDEF